MIRTAVLNGGRVVGVALLVALLVGAAPAAGAAGGVSVSVTPAAGGVDAGATTAFDVVVGNVTGGVGSAELRVVVDNPDVASITDVRIDGDPSAKHVDYAADGGWVDVSYAAANTTDRGDVRIVTVIVEGVAGGTTDVSLVPFGDRDAINLYGESGAGYEVAGVGGATLTVDGHHSNDGDDESDGTDSGTADTGTVDATATPTADGGTDATATTAAADADGDATGDGSTDEATTADGASATPTDPGNGSTVTETRTPGFTLGVALLALLAAGLVAVRRE